MLVTPKTGSEEQVVNPWDQEWKLKPVQAVVPIDGPAPESEAGMPWNKQWKEKAGVTPVRPSYNFQTSGKTTGGFNMAAYTDKLTAAESGGNDNAKAPTSSATGPHQFIDSTWNETVAKMGAKYTLEDRTDRAKSTKVLQRFTKDNIEQAKSDLGRDPTMTEAYMYHFIGSSAPKLIQAPSDAPAKNYITPEQYKANKAVFEGKTVGEVLGKYSKKFGEKNITIQREFINDPDPEYALINKQQADGYKKLMEAAASHPDYQKLESFLKARDAVPDIMAIYSGSSGEFQSSGMDRDKGKIGIGGLNNIMGPDGKVNKDKLATFVHESTHAADRQMRVLVEEIKSGKPTEQEQQFLDNFTKIMRSENGSKMGVISSVAKAMGAQWFKDNREYRSSTGELLGFGVGNQTKTKTDSHNAPSHLDASVATHFMQLLDQAQKIQDKRKKK